MTTTDWPTPAVPEPAAAAPAPVAKPKMRKFTWGILIFNALMALWLIVSLVHSGSQYNSCTADTYADACQAGTSIGTGIVIFMLVGFTAFVDAILGVLWVVTGRNRQH